MDSFAWTSVSQAAGLAGGSAVVSDGRGGGLLPSPMLGFHLPPPAAGGLEHFMDPGLVQLAVGSSCFAAAINGAPTTSEERPLQATTGSGNGEPGFVGGGGGGVYDDDAPSAEACSSRAPDPDSNSNSNKRKRSNEDVLGMIGTDQDRGMASKSNASADSSNERGEDDDAKGKGETPPATRKKKGKGASAADDESGPYIHVRARKGQATNRHSLAERLRREKISERMKLLQDLVPGCTKVTGKAVMLDEIINYVQSLQRQVEFLSMKLAAVNPQLGLNIKQLLTKDLFRTPNAPSVSSTHLGFSFSHEMMPKLPPLSRSDMLLGGVHGLANSDGFRTAMEEQLNGKDSIREHVSQMPLTLDGSFYNAEQTAVYGATVGPEHLSLRSDQDGFHL